MPDSLTGEDKRLGAWVSGSGVEFRVWAPHSKRVDVEFSTGEAASALSAEGDGHFHGRSDAARVNTRYRFRLDDAASHPDPYSRYQPDGPHEPSMVVDPDTYLWRDSAWQGLDRERQVIYELHVGTFTKAGTYTAAVEQLTLLRELGITCLELMPVNQFHGRFGWGYDGVNWFAPYHPYGDPDALRRFVDEAHLAGLGVILDVVYNHFGHDGNYMPQFDAAYVTTKFDNPWGGTPNYALPAMRRLTIDNAAYWMREFHMDGLRLDAIHSIHDPQHPSLLTELVKASRAAAGARSIVISAEDFLQRGPLLSSPEAASADVDLLWNDDFHHASRVALTGNHVGFFENYRGSAQEFVSCVCRGFLFQGQYDPLNNGPRGHSFRDRPLSALVSFTQNHDAVANTLDGRRIAAMVSPAKYRALTAVLLLGPQTPLIFMGQEFAASTPFAYFADYQGAGATMLWQGRRKEAERFETYRDPDAIACILDPCSEDTVKRSTLDFSERQRHPHTVRLFADLLKVRQSDDVLNLRPIGAIDGAVLNERAFVIRWFDVAHGDRLLLVNLGDQIEPRPWPEPLLAPASGWRWRLAWSSESPVYGGLGAINPLAETGWQSGAECASFLVSEQL